MAPSVQYQYNPLRHHREIRLLQIQPGEEHADTQLRIFPVILEENPTYEALSYTWGDASQKSPISCNEDGHMIEITLNCETALRRLRTKDEERTLWIDT